MKARNRIVPLIALGVLSGAGSAHAMDCPCTWEAVICEADAVAEVEMHLATKAAPDHMEVLRVVWNRTKQRVRPWYGLHYIPYVTKTRAQLRAAQREDSRDDTIARLQPIQTNLVRRALARGSYRAVVFLTHSTDGPWHGGGVAYLGWPNWLDHPRHAEWWAKIEPYLRERIEADKRGETPAFCSRTKREESQLRM